MSDAFGLPPERPTAAPSESPGRGGGRRGGGGHGPWWVAAGVAVVLVLATVVALVVHARTTPPGTAVSPSTASSTASSADTGGDSGGAAAEALTATEVTSARTVRFEASASRGTDASLSYGTQRDSVEVDPVSFPFAVEIPVTPGLDYLTIDVTRRAPTSAVVECRLSIDGVVVSQQRGATFATCSTSLSAFTGMQGADASPGPTFPSARAVTPTASASPSLPTAPTHVTFQVASTTGTPVEIAYGAAADSTSPTTRAPSPVPFTVTLPYLAATKVLSLKAGEVAAAPGGIPATLSCRISIDGVPVFFAEGRGEVSCVQTTLAVFGG